ncbi:MAG: hypothetical protein JWM12_1145 [Ilumatobacteraceae bacterium]|nr:hypothetical protein [Ilumatobacteraceae bacterium]
MLVTGGSGFLGRHLAEASEAGGWEWIAPPSQGLDVRDRQQVLHHIVDWRPSVVVHLAYRKHDASTIVEGSANVAAAAAACRARFVHLSTDVVFAGREAAYTEADRTDAVVDYGRWKAEAERRVVDAHPAPLMIRTSLLYGTSRLASWQVAIREREAITWFDDEVRCPAHVADVARAICALAIRPDVAGPLHIAGPEPVSRAGLAQAMAGWMHLGDGAVRVGSTPPTAPDRPGRVVLDTARAAALGIRCRSLAEALGR